jgi:hypothetical protein
MDRSRGPRFGGKRLDASLLVRRPHQRLRTLSAQPMPPTDVASPSACQR